MTLTLPHYMDPDSNRYSAMLQPHAFFFFPSDPHTQVGYLCANIYDARAREHAQQMGTMAKKNLFLFEG